MNYIPKHSAEQKATEARQAFYADNEIWDHEFDDPYETQDDEAVTAEVNA